MIHQLRIYEIFEHNKSAFHARFRDHAARIMRTYGFAIVAMWEVRSGDRTEFVYLLEWPDEAAMRAAWTKFLADEEWKAIKRSTSAQHGELVGAHQERVLIPTEYTPSLPRAPHPANPSGEGQPVSDKPASALPKEIWTSGDAYEPYVGRWSRLVARDFLRWLAVPAGRAWLDVGCGTGVISEAILQTAAPTRVKGVDRSEAHIAHAQAKIQDRRAAFVAGDAQSLPDDSASYDAAVSGLVLNFVPDPAKAAGEMVRVVKPGGVVAAYVWDYAGKMQLMRHFWNAAGALDPAALALDEGRRSPLCQPKPLAELFQVAGLKRVEVQAIDIMTDFKDFDDYWSPFLGGNAPAPAYAVSLSAERRAALRERIRAALPFALDGSIRLVARAWAVRGIRP